MESLYAAKGSGLWYRLPVKIKLFSLFFLMMGLLFSANIFALLFNSVFLLVIGTLWGGGSLLLLRLRPFLLFSLFIILFHSLLNPANENLWRWLGWEGFIYGSSVALRLTGIVILSQLFLMTTPPREIFHLFSSWHRDLGMIMLLLLGLLPVLREEMEVTAQAQQTRGLCWNNLISKLRAYLAMLIPVIIKSLYRAQGMAYLLYLRGYGEDGEKQRHPRDTFLSLRVKSYRRYAAVPVGFFIVNLALLLRYKL